MPVLWIAVAGVTLLFLWRYWYYGQLLPNSVVAKSGGDLIYRSRGAWYLLSGLSVILGVAAVGVIGIPAMWKRGMAWRVPLLVVGSSALFILFSGGDWMPGFRFFVPVIPLMMLIVMMGFDDIAHRAGLQVYRGAIALMIIVFMTSGHIMERSAVRNKYHFESGFRGIRWREYDSYFNAGREVRNNVPVGSLLAITEAGIIPYFNPGIRIMDLDGLMDPVIARLPGTPHSKLTAEYFFQRNPDYYLMAIRYPTNPEGNPVEAAYDDGKMLLASPEFQRRYSLLSLMPEFALFKRVE